MTSERAYRVIQQVEAPSTLIERRLARRLLERVWPWTKPHIAGLADAVLSFGWSVTEEKLPDARKVLQEKGFSFPRHPTVDVVREGDGALIRSTYETLSRPYFLSSLGDRGRLKRFEDGKLAFIVAHALSNMPGKMPFPDVMLATEPFLRAMNPTLSWARIYSEPGAHADWLPTILDYVNVLDSKRLLCSIGLPSTYRAEQHIDDLRSEGDRAEVGQSARDSYPKTEIRKPAERAE